MQTAFGWYLSKNPQNLFWLHKLSSYCSDNNTDRSMNFKSHPVSNKTRTSIISKKHRIRILFNNGKSLYFSGIKRKNSAHCAKQLAFRIFLRRSHKMNIRLFQSPWSMMFYFFPNGISQNYFLKIAKQFKAVQLIKMHNRACITYCSNVRFIHGREGPIPHRPR